MPETQSSKDFFLEVQINQSKTVFVELLSINPNIYTLKSKDCYVTLINAL